MDALIWGPVTWNFLHFLSIAYPEKPLKDDIYNNKIFLETLAKILPCTKCRNHFSKNLDMHNLDEELSSRERYMKFIWNIHNNVNKDIGKKTMEFNDFLNTYQNIIDYGNFNPILIYKENRFLRKCLTFIGLVIVALLIYYFVMFNKKHNV